MLLGQACYPQVYIVSILVKILKLKGNLGVVVNVDETSNLCAEKKWTLFTSKN